MTRTLIQAALLAFLPLAANADTIARFDWVGVSNGSTGHGSGDLMLTLPGGVAGPLFNVAFANNTAAMNAVTGFLYTFSNGDVLTLNDLKGGSLALNSLQWKTTNMIAPAGAPSGVYLGSGFQFAGFTTPSDGILTPFNLVSSGGIVSLGAGAAQLQITDTGYWKLDSLTPVPLPAGLWLLVSGAAGFLGLARRKAA